MKNLLLAVVMLVVGAAITYYFLHPDPAHDFSQPHEHGTVPWEWPTRYPDRIALTWSEDPATSLSVTWRTDTTVARAVAQVAPARPAPRLDRIADSVEAATERLDARLVEGEHVRVHYHSVTFRDLEPNTLYAYRVGDGEIWSEWFHARTASAGPEPFSFLYFGDAQNGLQSHWSRAIRAAYSEAPRALFVIHAGDLVNRAHRNLEWGEWFYAGGWIHGMLPAVPVPGNHEYQRYSGTGLERHLSVFWRPQFTLPENGPAGLEETTYSLDIQGARLIGLNSNVDPDGQTAWLDSVLTDNPNRWTIVTFHHPVFSSAGDRDNPELRAAWKPVFDRHGVDLVLQGHDHTYARGRVLNAPGGVNTRDSSTGTVYVNSVSGAKMYDVKGNRWSEFGAVMERAAENTQLFQVVHVGADTLGYRAFTVTGELYDAFALVKQPDGPNLFFDRTPPVEERTHDNTVPYRVEGE